MDPGPTPTTAAPLLQSHQLEPRRACQECNRKKTKCDMRRPVCGLCLRTGNSCTFPAKRKKPVSRKPQQQQFKLHQSSRKLGDSLSKLVRVLEAASKASDEQQQRPSQVNGEGAGGSRREIPQDLLRESLKGLLSEITTSESEDRQQTRDTDQQNPSLERTDPHPIISGGEEPDRHENSDDDMDDDDDQDEDDNEDEGVYGDTNHRDRGGQHQDPHRPPAHDMADSNVNVASSSRESSNFDAGVVNSSVAIDLVNLFFDKIQPWLPLLHRPRFQARYERTLRVDGNVMERLAGSVDESLLFYSMFAMSARFSDHPRFAGVPSHKRGQDFADRARDVYTQARTLRAPSLTYLQGCILLAFYFYTSGPTHQGWILIGVCVRMAYELGLSEIDDDDWAPPLIAPADAVEKEEMRRAWWLVWELDTFASTVARHPFSIDRKRMSVKLPISDEAWFAGVDVPSWQLNWQPGQSWRSLHGGPNQDERAWFLVANSFMASLHDRLQQKHEISVDEKLTLENEVCCFKLALPPSLRLDVDTLTFGLSTFARCNWVVGTHLMLMAASFMIAGIVVTSDGSGSGGGDDHSVSSLTANNGASPIRQRAVDLSRIISLWDSRYIAVAHPFFTCMMLPPYAVDTEVYRTQPLVSSTQDLAKLVLEYFARKWTLGSVVTEVAKMLERGGPANPEEKQLVKRYATFFRIPRLTASSPASSLQPDYNNRRARNGSMASENPSYSIPEIRQPPPPPPPPQQQPQPPPIQDFPPTGLDMSNHEDVANYQTSTYDLPSFSSLQPDVFDASNELGFGFTDFFGAYGDTEFSLT